jgi:hypothetical protein
LFHYQGSFTVKTRVCSLLWLGLFATGFADTVLADGLTPPTPSAAPIPAPAPDQDYLRAKWDPIHFPPAIDTATDAQCLACHQEILDRRVRDASPAGVKTSDTLAWYQTLSTYSGEQDSFHRRHLLGDYAQQVKDLRCNTCHQGNDPREETASSAADGLAFLTQRKSVDPNICLMCHGQFPYKSMALPGSWPTLRDGFANNCLLCHAAIRTNRHQVNYLKPAAIEAAGKTDGDVCYGCHGGRAWYRINYPYPRHTWTGMPTAVPDWAKDRPTESETRFHNDPQPTTDATEGGA